MRRLGTILGLVFALAVFSPQAQAQKSIADILESKTPTSSGMKSRTFKKPPAEDKKDTEAVNKAFEELPEGAKGKTPPDPAKPPEEDVWERYKSIAQGTGEKKLEQKSYVLGGGAQETPKRKNFKAEAEAEAKKEDAEKPKPEAKKSGITAIMEDYREKQLKNTGIRTRGMND